MILSLCEKVVFSHFRLDDDAICARFECWDGQEWNVAGVAINFHPIINPAAFQTFVFVLCGREAINFPYFGGNQVVIEPVVRVTRGAGELRFIVKHKSFLENLRPVFESIQMLGHCNIYGKKKVSL